MQIHRIAQNTHEWDLLRAGVATASQMDCLFTPTFGIPKKTTKTMLEFAASLAADKYSGLPLSRDDYWKGNDATRRAHELEPVAFNEYKFKYNPDIEMVGFVSNGDVGCSPDGLGLTEGGLEMKCFLAKKHTRSVKECMDGICPGDIYVQIQASMWICQREWWDLYLYHPHLPCARLRVAADHDFFDKLATQCLTIIYERNLMIDAFKLAENM